MDPSSCEILHEEKNSKLKVDRVHANFPPSLWGRYFANFSLNKELWEKYSTEVERLKEQVKIMLMNQEQEPLDKMTFIDILERLGVAYHFEDEIEQLLQKLFGTFDYNDDYDLYNIALHFRIFRQHGYNISCDVFNKFKGSDGILKENLSNDVMGMLSLYEAANLAKEGDDILDEALILTKTSLQNLLPTLTSSLAVQVKQAMDLCLHRTLPRIAARNYIDTYEKDPLRDEILLYFAKIDYNLLQLLHHQELSAITRWWDDLVTNFPYARDRIVEDYFWCLGIYFEPHYATSRIALTKVIGMLSIIDDTFDSYGTLDELKRFRDAAERWDADAIELLPDYLKLLYKSMLDLFESLDMEFMIQGRSSGASIVKQDIQEIIRSYYLETKWFVEGHMPSFDEYLRNGLVTSTVFSLISASFLGMRGSTTNEEAFEWLRTKPKALIACATLTRLIDDVGTYEVEKARGQIATGIECYMYQYGVSREEAVNEFNYRVERAWKDMNEECIKPTPVSYHYLQRVVNFARLMEVTYRKGDGYTHPEKSLKDVITSLLKFPIALP